MYNRTFGGHMRLYKTNRGVRYCVFSDAERDKIKEEHDILIKMKQKIGQVDNWNKNDEESLYEIMTWPFSYLVDGPMTDLTDDQISKMNIMLAKLFEEDITFFDIMDLWFDEGVDPLDTDTYMTDYDMRNEMVRRRALAQRVKSTCYSHRDELFDWDYR